MLRQYVQFTATRLEQAPVDEQDFLFVGTEEEWGTQPQVNGSVIVWLDGDKIRRIPKVLCFDVIVGKSVVAFKHDNPKTSLQRNALVLCKPMIRSRGDGYGI